MEKNGKIWTTKCFWSFFLLALLSGVSCNKMLQENKCLFLSKYHL